MIGESSGVTVDLVEGTVTVDRETLLAANPDLPNLNEMDPNSQLLSGEVTAAIADGITQAITDVVTEVVSGLQDTIAATELGLVADVQLLFGAVGITVTLHADLRAILDGGSEGSLSVESSGFVSAVQQHLNPWSLYEPS